MQTKIKPNIPIFATKSDEDANFHVFVFFLWHSLRQLNYDSIKLRHPKNNYSVKHASGAMVNGLSITAGQGLNGIN